MILRHIVLLAIFGWVALVADINITKTVVTSWYEANATNKAVSYTDPHGNSTCIAKNASETYTFLLTNGYFLETLPVPSRPVRGECDDVLLVGSVGLCVGG